jgi:hypothetical protein
MIPDNDAIRPLFFNQNLRRKDPYNLADKFSLVRFYFLSLDFKATKQGGQKQ